MNNGVLPRATGGSHWLTYLPGYMYCFVPSIEASKGTALAYNYIPDFLLEFLFCAEIKNVTFELSGCNNTNMDTQSDGSKGSMRADEKSNQSGWSYGNKSGLRALSYGNKFNSGLINADFKNRHKEMSDAYKYKQEGLNNGNNYNLEKRYTKKDIKLSGFILYKLRKKQAGAELCQAQAQLSSSI